MPTRMRKLLGSIGVLGFLALYVTAAVALYRHVPRQPGVQLAYFAVAGMVWGAPLIPLIRWMNGSPGVKGSPVPGSPRLKGRPKRRG